MRKTRSPHDIGHRHAIKTALAEQPRGGFENEPAVLRYLFLTDFHALSKSSLDLYMMGIINTTIIISIMNRRPIWPLQRQLYW